MTIEAARGVDPLAAEEWLGEQARVFTEMETRSCRLAVMRGGADVLVLFGKPVGGLVFSEAEAQRFADLVRGAAAAGNPVTAGRDGA